ncbi:MAG: hypothetical protein KF773_26990 [Deltaproteobacteria bacterium]|nr:hypothetical protein [Deltaproteobacteria bacterium]
MTKPFLLACACAVMMAACALFSTEHGEGNAPVPRFCTGNVQTGDRCFNSDVCMWSEPFDGGKVPAVHTCFCEFGQYRCSSCPANVTDFNATCTPGDTCDFVSFEICDCACESDGRWRCIGRDSRQRCDGAFPPDDPFPVDAGGLPF